jgi:hypothetical protein
LSYLFSVSLVFQDTDYNLKAAPANAAAVNAATLDPVALANAEAYVAGLVAKANAGEITIGDAINLAILEEMLRDPTCVRQFKAYTIPHPPLPPTHPCRCLLRAH